MGARPESRTGHGHDDRVLDRFWRKVRILGPDECWDWRAYCHKDGYGRFQPGGRDVGKLNAQRFAYLVCMGPLSEGEVVRHTCDNPKCCNPAHLVAGTHGDNMSDKRDRCRQHCQLGERAPNRKLDWDKVDMIRGCSTSICVLAERLGVTKSTISNVRSGLTWPESRRAEEVSALPTGWRSRSKGTNETAPTAGRPTVRLGGTLAVVAEKHRRPRIGRRSATG